PLHQPPGIGLAQPADRRLLLVVVRRGAQSRRLAALPGVERVDRVDAAVAFRPLVAARTELQQRPGPPDALVQFQRVGVVAAGACREGIRRLLVTPDRPQAAVASGEQVLAAEDERSRRADVEGLPAALRLLIVTEFHTLREA